MLYICDKGGNEKMSLEVKWKCEKNYEELLSEEDDLNRELSVEKINDL